MDVDGFDSFYSWRNNLILRAKIPTRTKYAIYEFLEIFELSILFQNCY
jgi:hypothetical protein